MKKISYLAIFFCIIFGISSFSNVNAQMKTYCIDGTVYLQTTDKNGTAITAPYKHKTVAWLKSDNKTIAYSPNNPFMFCGLSNGVYKVEVFLESDLLNPYKEPVPIYQDTFTISDKSTMFMYPTTVVPEKIIKTTIIKLDCGLKTYNMKCNTGTTALCNQQTGMPYCSAPTYQPSIDLEEMENQIFAMINYNKEAVKVPVKPSGFTRLEPFQHNDILKNEIKNYSTKMATENFFSFIDPQGCDDLCRFNKNKNLPSNPSDLIKLHSTYGGKYKNGTIAIYNTPYKIVKDAVSSWNKIKIKTTSEDNYFEVSMTASGEKIYIDMASMTDFTEAEKEEIRGIINNLMIYNGSSAFAENSKEWVEKTLAGIYDWVTKNIAYDYKSMKQKGGPSFTSVGTFRNLSGVCQGYSELFRYMLNEVGIDSYNVSGWCSAKGCGSIGHQWNKVAVDNKDYYFDTTWDSGFMSGKLFVWNPQTKYFMIPEECIKIDHFTDKKQKVKDKKIYIENNKEIMMANCKELVHLYHPVLYYQLINKQ